MSNFSWNRASDYRTIWIPDKLVWTTIGGGQIGYHLKNGPVVRWLKQDGSRKCFNYLKTGLVFRWLTLWRRASEYRISICSVFKWFRYSDVWIQILTVLFFKLKYLTKPGFEPVSKIMGWPESRTRPNPQWVRIMVSPVKGTLPVRVDSNRPLADGLRGPWFEPRFGRTNCD
jgi:hypothetical protein